MVLCLCDDDAVQSSLGHGAPRWTSCCCQGADLLLSLASSLTKSGPASLQHQPICLMYGHCTSKWCNYGCRKQPRQASNRQCSCGGVRHATNLALQLSGRCCTLATLYRRQVARGERSPLHSPDTPLWHCGTRALARPVQWPLLAAATPRLACPSKRIRPGPPLPLSCV